MRHRDFLTKILADPSDTASRLVYGDWLAEQGDPRGVFIGYQCRLADMDGLEPDYPMMLASTRRLEAQHAATWLTPLFEHVEKLSRYQNRSRNQVNALLNPVFERGFLQQIALVPSDLAGVSSWLRAHEPIEGVEIVVDEGIAPADREQPGPFPWSRLKVSPDGWFTSYSLAQILCWGFPNVRHIDVGGCSLSADGSQLLANLQTKLGDFFPDHTIPPPLPAGGVLSWGLRGTQIGDEGLATLLAAETNAASVQSLDLTQCRLEQPSSLQALAQAPSFAKLRRLSLAGNNAFGGKLTALERWPALASLVHFALPQTATIEDLRALFPAPSRTLRSLDLAGNKLVAKDLSAVLAAASHFTELNLGTTSLGDAAFQSLVSSPSCASLLALKVNGCSLSDKAIEALVTSPLQRLVNLDISSNKLTDKSVAALAGWPGLQFVTHLRLGNNKKVGAGLAALVDAKQFDPVELDIGSLGDDATVKKLEARFGSRIKRRD